MSEISETEIKSMTKEQNYMRGYEDGKSDVLNKIKDEIKDNTYFINETTEKEGIDFETVEKIIDKYKSESEGKE